MLKQPCQKQSQHHSTSLLEAAANTPHADIFQSCPSYIKQNTMERKRRGAPLEAVPEAKRQGRGKSPAEPAASNQTVSTAAVAAPAAEETFQDIHDRTGMTVQDILNRKLTFKKGTLAQKKLEEMGPVIKELK
jgi:hypothetical protein